MNKRVAMAVTLLALLTAALGTATANATSSAASSGFSAKANAICAKAIAQKKAAKYVPPADPRAMAFAAANGAKWLAADNAAFKALEVLKAPTDNADDFKVMLTKRQGAIAALVKAVKAAKAGSRATFLPLYLKSSTLAGGSGLRAWSMELKACENWY
jgi:hypothetical protein